VGKDHFDEIVSRFIDMVGQPNVISISPVSYSTLDLASHQILTDYGAMIVYRG